MICPALVATLSLAGCDRTPMDSTTGAPTRTPTPAASTSAAFHPGGSVSVGCDAARSTNPTEPPPNPADDLVIGPLVYPGLGNGYNYGFGPHIDADGIAFFKEGAELPADTTVTVSIGAPARTWAGILIESGPAAGYSSVTYRSCSSKSQSGRVSCPLTSAPGSCGAGAASKWKNRTDPPAYLH